jgi:hypothetical protein
MKPEIVFCVYRPHAGKEAEFQKILATHVPTLKEAGLITDREPVHAKSLNGEYIEVFEWRNGKSAEEAHHHPMIAKVWESMGQVSSFTSLDQLAESKKPFTHFAPVSLLQQ